MPALFLTGVGGLHWRRWTAGRSGLERSQSRLVGWRFRMIRGVELKPLKIYPDDRGFFMETLRQDDPFFRGFGQSAVTVSSAVLSESSERRVLTDG